MKKHFLLLLQGLVFTGLLYSQKTITSLESALREAPENVKVLNIRQKNFYDFPFELQKFDSLEYLNLMKNRLGEVPKWINKFEKLEVLNLRQNLLFDVGGMQLPSLKTLKLEKNQLDTLLWQNAKLPELQYLLLSNNALSYMDNGICSFSKLKDLSIDFNELISLPKCTKFDSLEVLHAESNKLIKMPFDNASMIKLRELHLANNQIQLLPIDFGKYESIEVLNLSNNKLSQIPESIGNLKKLKILTLSGNNLQKLPSSIKNCTSLRYIYLLNNPISDEEMKKIKSLLPGCQVLK